MANCETTNELIELQQKLGKQMQGELPILCTSVAGKVVIENQDIRQEIQDNLNHATGCLSVVYTFPLLEQHKFNISNRWLEPTEKTILKAWKHVRHSAAHGFDRTRASRYRAEFDNTMGSQYPLPCIENWDSTSIKVNSIVGFRCLEYFHNLIPQLIARSASA